MEARSISEPAVAYFPLSGSEELAARINAYNWSNTSLGPIECWPQSLRTALSILLGSRFPMQLLWGPEYIHFYNDAYRPIASDKHPAALGRPGAVVWPEVWDIVAPLLDYVLATGEATWSDDQLLVLERHGALEEGYFTFSYSPVRGDVGTVDGIFIAVTETSRRVIGERRLRTARDLGGALAGMTSEAGVLDAVRDVLSRNPHDIPFALLYLLDATGQSLRRACAINIAPDHPAAPAILALDESSPWPFGEALQTNQAVFISELPFTLPTLPGGPWDTLAHSALVLPLRSAGASAEAFLVMGISPRVRLDAEYREFAERIAAQVAGALGGAQAVADADAAVRVRDDFLLLAAHELKNPLTPLIGKLQLIQRRLARDMATAQHVEAIDTVVAEAKRLVMMIDVLLDISRLRSGQLSIERASLDLRGVVEHITAEVQPTLVQHDLVLRVPDAPVMIEGDMLRLEQVVRNLVGNAVKYSPDGGTVELTVDAGVQGAHVTVRDQGIGIPGDALRKLFERYYRAENVDARTIGGFGVGLYVVYEIVRLHGGSIFVESEPGCGSTFTVVLPTEAERE
jgi:signal transduction histidine kinase